MISNISFTFTYPWLLLLLIPGLALSLFPYFRTAKKYRRNRNRIISLVAHTTALTLCVFLLSGLTMHYDILNKSNQVILLVDASSSNQKEQENKDEFIRQVLEVADDSFQVGVVKFGYDQAYVAELSYDVDKVYEEYLRSEDPATHATNVEEALKYAATLFDNPATAKIVLISDGYETDGSVLSAIKGISAKGIRVDVKCFPNEAYHDVQIMGVELPDENIVPDETFNLLVNMQATEIQQFYDLVVYDNGEELKKLETAFDYTEQTEEIECMISKSGLHEIRVVAEVHASRLDTVVENDVYITYVNIESFENILVLEYNEGESNALCQILNENYYVTTYSVEEDLELFPSTIEEFCLYEQIVLVNVAYSDMPDDFEILLNEYVQDLGGGLLTVGGENKTDGEGNVIPHAYNRADVDDSIYFKQMLPVLTEDYTPPVAVMIIIDTSSSMGSGAGSNLAAALDGARNCVDLLSDRDYCGVVSFTTITNTVSSILPVAKRQEIYNAINALEAGDTGGGTTYPDAISLAGVALKQVNVERKHIVFISDGQPGDSQEDYLQAIQNNAEEGITLSTLGINLSGSGASVMQSMATAGGGAYYNAASASEIPGYMSTDLRVEAIPEVDYGTEFKLTIENNTHVTEGIDESELPTLTGYYGTTAKVGAEVILMGKYVPVYVEWNYGNGRVGSFMSDLNGTWSANFINDPIGKAVINNVIKGLFPATAPTPQKIDYMLSSDNCSNELSIFGIEETDQLEVIVIPHNTMDDSYIEDVPVVALESNRRFQFEIFQAGIYEISISRYDQDGELICETIIYKAFSYSQEYNSFLDREPIGEELLTMIATDGNGTAVEDVLSVYDGFLKKLSLIYDPRMLILIVSIVLVLIDIAVRKFKFKWIHELIRERKEKMRENEAQKR